MANILIVDDDNLITGLMQSLVTISGHQPFVVNDSLQAMNAAKSSQPALITLDLMMPNLTGFEVCTLLRADPQFAQTPIVIISAKEDPQSKEEALASGATEYMTKPFNIEDFIGMIKRYTVK
jgi:DNA-binding response OmpR family regulator